MEVSSELKEEIKSLISEKRSKSNIREVVLLCDTYESALIFGEIYNRKDVDYYSFYIRENVKLVFTIEIYNNIHGYRWTPERARSFRDREVIVLSTLLGKCPSYKSQDG